LFHQRHRLLIQALIAEDRRENIVIAAQNFIR